MILKYDLRLVCKLSGVLESFEQDSTYVLLKIVLYVMVTKSFFLMLQSQRPPLEHPQVSPQPPGQGQLYAQPEVRGAMGYQQVVTHRHLKASGGQGRMSGEQREK